MIETSKQLIEFILNDQKQVVEVDAGMLALDFVRKQLQLTGTKEGCKEGDCGACSVIVGELKTGLGVVYKPVTSCLLPMGELHGKHLVTIEGLNMKSGLSPVQAAMVDTGGTQCGYCTPGFVVTMTAGLMEPKLPLNAEGALYAISGNLCRCTGYRSIKEAGRRVMDQLSSQLVDTDRVTALVEAEALPKYFTSIAERLDAIPAGDQFQKEPNPDAVVVAGGTDLYVQCGEELPEQAVDLINLYGPVAGARLDNGRVILDARMTFEAFADDPVISEMLSSVVEYNLLIASWPVRTRSTLGGNICNASPIADMTCLLLALEAELTLRNAEGVERVVPLKAFYTGYKQMAKSADEVVMFIQFPVVTPDVSVNWEKVSKRAWLDIATVNSAAKLRVNSGLVVAAHLALGGVAATPLYLEQASAYLVGKALEVTTVVETLKIAQQEFQPISDVRGSATYKRLLARQLLVAHFERLFGDQLDMEAVYATL